MNEPLTERISRTLALRFQAECPPIPRMLGSWDAETVEAHNSVVGKTIKSLDISGDQLFMRFTDGTGIHIWDDGQSCCEVRHMHCDDDLDAFVGAEFRGAEVREGGTKESEWGVWESQFLIVNTSIGSFTVANYNERNGYYGGFDITVRPLDPEPTP
jgi:hypothetical protein